MLLLLTSVRQFFSLHILPTCSSACAAVSAHRTFAPRLVISISNCSRYLSRCSIAFHFVCLAFSRANITSLNCDLPTGTVALYLPILKLILRRCSRSPDLILL